MEIPAKVRATIRKDISIERRMVARRYHATDALSKPKLRT
jgi:hypothetical protein